MTGGRLTRTPPHRFYTQVVKSIQPTSRNWTRALLSREQLDYADFDAFLVREKGRR